MGAGQQGRAEWTAGTSESGGPNTTCSAQTLSSYCEVEGGMMVEEWRSTGRGKTS